MRIIVLAVLAFSQTFSLLIAQVSRPGQPIMPTDDRIRELYSAAQQLMQAGLTEEAAKVRRFADERQKAAEQAKEEERRGLDRSMLLKLRQDVDDLRLELAEVRRLLAGGSTAERAKGPLADNAVLLFGTRSFRHGGDIKRVLFGKDARFIASAGLDGTIRLWDPEKGTELAGIDNKRTIYDIALSPDGSRIAAANVDRRIRIWNVETRELAAELNISLTPTRIAYSPDGSLLAGGDHMGWIGVWNVADQKQILKAHFGEGPRQSLESLEFSPDGTLLATAGLGGVVFWEVRSGKAARSLEVDREAPHTMAFSPDGRSIAVSAGARLAFLDFDGVHERHSAYGHERRTISDIKFSSDGKHVLSADVGGTVVVWDAASAKQEATFSDPTGVTSIAVSPDGKTAVTGGVGHVVRRWDLATRKELPAEGDLLRLTRVYSVALSPDGHSIASLHQGGTLCLWDTDSRQRRCAVPCEPSLRELQPYHQVGPHSVAMSPNGKSVAVAGGKSRVYVCDFHAPAVRELQIGNGATCIAFGSDRLLAIGVRDGGLQLWDIEDGKNIRTLGPDRGFVIDCAFTPDGKNVVATASGRTVQVFEAETGSLVRDISLGNYAINAMAISPDGKMLATVGVEAVRLWNLDDGSAVKSFNVAKRLARCVAFAPGGKIVACGDADGIEFWDTSNGTLVGRLRGHIGAVVSIAFTPDGNRIVSGSDDTTIMLWNVPEFVR